MGRETDLEQIYQIVIDQFRKGDYEKIQCSGKNIKESVFNSLFSNLFLTNNLDDARGNFDLQTQRYLIIRWAEQRNDQRPLNHFKYYFQPITQPDLLFINFYDLLIFVSPENKETIEQVIKYQELKKKI